MSIVGSPEDTCSEPSFLVYIRVDFGTTKRQLKYDMFGVSPCFPDRHMVFNNYSCEFSLPKTKTSPRKSAVSQKGKKNSSSIFRCHLCEFLGGVNSHLDRLIRISELTIPPRVVSPRGGGVGG